MWGFFSKGLRNIHQTSSDSGLRVDLCVTWLEKQSPVGGALYFDCSPPYKCPGGRGCVTHRCCSVWPRLRSERRPRKVQTERSGTHYSPGPPQGWPLHSHRSPAAEINTDRHAQIAWSSPRHVVRPDHPCVPPHLSQVSSAERDPLDEVGHDIISGSLPAHGDIAAWEISHSQVWGGGHLH